MSIIVNSVVVHDHAKQDLIAIASSDKESVAIILTLLQELKSDPSTTIDKLTTHGDNDFGDFTVNVKSWKKVVKIGNLWRLRVLDTPATKYRVIYGYDFYTHQLCVLAIVEKESYDYDDLTSQINQRIITDWKSI